MRDLKFRVWDGERMLFMGKGGYCEFELCGGQICIPDSVGYEYTTVDYPLMQSTGLKDKNGVEIFEGDILSPSFYKKAKFGNSTVIHKDGMFCFAINKPFISSTKPLINSLRLGDKANNSYEVIGNIHENPELLT